MPVLLVPVKNVPHLRNWSSPFPISSLSPYAPLNFLQGHESAAPFLEGPVLLLSWVRCFEIIIKRKSPGCGVLSGGLCLAPPLRCLSVWGVWEAQAPLALTFLTGRMRGLAWILAKILWFWFFSTLSPADLLNTYFRVCKAPSYFYNLKSLLHSWSP